jgi:diguanylate cyclase (GGDEF)-like protein
MQEMAGISVVARNDAAVPSGAQTRRLINQSGRPLRILLSAADPFSRRSLQAGLRDRGFEVSVAWDGVQARQYLNGDDPPDIAVLDTESEGVSGIDLCRDLRSGLADIYTYTVLLVPSGERETVIQGLQAGADDCLAKPFHQPELLARVDAGCRIVRHQQQLRALRDEYLRRSTRDGLTSLLNRTTILDHLARELSRARRNESPLGIIMADVDEFKAINDTFGHQAGDAALRSVASALVDGVRPYDSVGRYGGEEFLVVLPDCDIEETAVVAERLRQGVAAAPVVWGGARLDATISLGIAAVTPPAIIDMDRFVHCADAALYRAKAEGRNRVARVHEIAMGRPMNVGFSQVVGG